MNAMKKIAVAVATVAMVTGTSMGAQLLTGGNIPLINNIVGVGVLTLDFSSAAPQPMDVANFIINNNGNSFDVSWTFSNEAKFAKNGTENIAMTALTIEENTNQPAGSALGTDILLLLPGTTKAANPITVEGDILDLANNAGGVVEWNPAAQTTATMNYSIIMRAEWGDSSTKLAGLYTETITFSIVATVL